MRLKTFDCIALTITIIGAVNWGLVGVFDLSVVSLLFGGMSWLSRIIYALVGLCGLYLITFILPTEIRMLQANHKLFIRTHSKARSISI